MKKKMLNKKVILISILLGLGITLLTVNINMTPSNWAGSARYGFPVYYQETVIVAPPEFTITNFYPIPFLMDAAFWIAICLGVLLVIFRWKDRNIELIESKTFNNQ